LQGACERILQLIEEHGGILAGPQGGNDAPDRAHGVDEAPEGAEQAEEHQQARHVAQDLAALVETRAHRIEQRARGGDGKRLVRPVADEGRHGG
jgi:hypothetical protein